jgi:hypothetical protein
MALCYGHFALKSRSGRGFLSRCPAWERGAVVLIALVACGFLAPTALATPSPVATAPLAAPAAFDGQVTAAAPTAAVTPDPSTTAAPAPADIPPADPNADAATNQSASSAATATQQQPVNVVVNIRVNSPGKNGPVTQNNITVAPSTAANNASTTQGGFGGNEGASTAQQANATATATQDAAGNLVINVRIDSPGSNGAIAQTNGVVGSSSGTNTSDTTQKVAAPTPAVLPQAHRAGAASSRRPPRHRPSRHRELSAAAPAPAEGSTPQASTASAKPTSTQRPPAHRHAAAAQEPRGNTHHRLSLSSIAAGAARAVSPLVPQASPVTDSAGPQNVSRAVLLTLLALVAAAATFAVFRRTTVRRQAASWRSR